MKEITRPFENTSAAPGYTPDEELLIRIKVAGEIIDKAYTDYCKNPNHSRTQARDFCDFVIEVNDFCHKLENEIKRADVCQ